MRQVVIENPVLNSPYTEPTRHFRFTDDGITNEIVEGRRVSSYFMPIPRPRSSRGKAKQLSLGSEWTQDRVEENRFINRIRERVGLWRRGGYKGITRTTARLLDYWQRPDRERRLFFCQLEALESVIYIAEVASKYGDAWIEQDLRAYNADANPELVRIACKMATGSGKTVVMAMLIAWQTLNKFANPQDARFSDIFLIVTPGITIRDRLRVLLPNDPHNYYRALDVVPPDLMPELGRAKILITNFHAFKPREKVIAGKLTKQVLAQGDSTAFTEMPAEVVRRVCRELGAKKNIVVINDEAHHCYRRKPDGDTITLTGEDRAEAEQREEEARIWISGLEAVKAKLGIKAVYDLSATPFFLRGSGYQEGTLFPWVVSDFSLIDAIESGIVKVPRVPVADDAMTGEMPTYRDLWSRIRDELPRKGRATEKLEGEPRLPAELEGALQTLYANYERYFRQWRQSNGAHAAAHTGSLTPPVFIVVCNNTNVSQLVFRYIAGYEKSLTDGATVPVPGQLALFSNVADRQWVARPNTILVDSAQLESGEGMSADFKKVAAREIAEFKAEYRTRFPDRDADELTDEDLLREVMNTVGKPGRLGEQVKCVVSVSMLTEGWDANTVTHILGVRAFGTQLLCEQVVGRGLRRMSYVAGEDCMFEPEYAEVYGVPFSFIPCSGSTPTPKPGRAVTRVRALEDRAACELSFPRLAGYVYDLPADGLTARFTRESQMTLSSADIPLQTEVAPIFGQSAIHYLDLRHRRVQEVAFLLAKRTLERHFPDGETRAWLFPQLLDITRRWLAECVVCKDRAFPQMLLIAELAERACGRIYRSIVEGRHGEQRLRPLLRPYDAIGSTRYVDFDTARPVYATRADKCHVSHVVADTDVWEQLMAFKLEQIPEVLAYVKNDHLNFAVPYIVDGLDKSYLPDYLVRIDDGHGPDDPLNLIVEVSGADREDKQVKVHTTRALWLPAVNNHGGFGRWDYLEIKDPWNAETLLRAKALRSVAVKEVR